MTKKDRTIKAFEELAHKYRNPEWIEIFFSESYCPLCEIHNKRGDQNCRGCPLLRESASGYGCIDFTTYRKASGKYGEVKHISKSGKPCAAFIKRAEFFEKYLPVIKKWPASRFTKKGWIYSGDEISRED